MAPFACLLRLTLSLASAVAEVAPAPAPATPFAASLAAEYPLSLGILASTAVLNGAVKQTLGGDLPCRTLDNGGRCDPAHLWAWDRRSLTLRSRGWSITSDVGQGMALGGSAVMVLADALLHHRGKPVTDAATDFVVLLESVALSTGVNQVLKYAVRRPRPQLYQLGGNRGVESELSFPSGHTQATAAALTAWSTIFWVRHPQSRWRYVPYGVSAATTGLVAYGRVATPKHFASDVFVGAILGGVIGFAVPKLHAKWPERALHLSVTAPSAGVSPSMGVSLNGRL